MRHKDKHYEKFENHNHHVHEHEHEHTYEYEHGYDNRGSLNDIQRLKALISYWIEHNTGHLEKIRESVKLAEGKGEAAKYLIEALNYMQKSVDSLKLALKNL
ncbi:MAG: hypothetical protein QXO71_02605 [Candidatus Jordarchaeaceae archaeon]